MKTNAIVSESDTIAKELDFLVSYLMAKKTMTASNIFDAVSDKIDTPKKIVFDNFSKARKGKSNVLAKKLIPLIMEEFKNALTGYQYDPKIEIRKQKSMPELLADLQRRIEDLPSKEDIEELIDNKMSYWVKNVGSNMMPPEIELNGKSYIEK